MNVTELIRIISPAAVMTVIMFLIMQKQQHLSRAGKIVFYSLFFAYEVWQGQSITNTIVFYLGKVVFILMMSGLLLINDREKSFWKIPAFFAGVFSVRVFFDLAVYVWLSVASSFHMEQIADRMNGFEREQWLLCLLIYIPAGVISYFLDESMRLLPTRLQRLVMICMMFGDFVVGGIDRWREILILMPFTLMFFFMILFYRIKLQGEKEKQLYYSKQLEVQMQKKNEELEALRKEVQKYYQRAQQKESGAYQEQVLNKLDALIDKDVKDNSI